MGTTVLELNSRVQSCVVMWTACGVLLCASVLGAAGPPVFGVAPDLLPQPERSVAPGAKAISIIDSRTVQCDIPDPEADVCELRWESLSVSAGSDYVTHLTVKIDGRVRAISTGFFQTSMYIPFGMYSAPFRVECGKLGSGGDPDLGMAHTYYIEAFDTTGALASNFGAVLCPASVLLFTDGFEGGDVLRWSAHTP